MDCFFINLDRETGRRRRLEEKFNRFRTENWRLIRLPAITSQDVIENEIGGCLSPAEKACFLSHREAILNAAKGASDALITEDDALFGASTFAVLDSILSGPDAFEADVIFTEVGIPDVETQFRLVKIKQNLPSQSPFVLMDLKGIPSFFAASSYVVRKKSAHKLLDRLSRFATFDAPYDIALRQLIHAGEISAAVIFPFVTSISDDSLTSSIQAHDRRKTDAVWMAFRRMIWSDARQDECDGLLGRLDDEIDAGSRSFGRIWALMADKSFTFK
ncbi:Glycosyltransferase involved in LPS biosynthesis, GR25 family [Rhodoblastus acidophilus]|uniref:Glycosyltransferase involved in LPS biosynthesis, GR25 family n=1 Tax=Rhodoblastus acidophilus TaxID=1074 RepID=A0A212S590_RHOAC|nr:glycosyltransferase family 25 protein [Rhodoblastus acidophilus]MCW2318436.1 GR25 family glycosyltransferase involved in LPS biosynthesis [Rhodoblastus acidophilus]PPQ37518.1 hypothetical protein CKO16_14165 [Rhodoblastus acidophilus]RAI19664.1 hypothetical protein CH337_11550 [Rhodoblastus acidophilus]SNB80406.1 Glycosyltransferase involved in LPS biosynthesis, GR25 family [Rhodoblastus acidophilus]